MKLRCKLGFHKWEDGDIQITKRVCFGPGIGAPPGMRLKQKCSYCFKERYMNLNLYMPEECLHKEYLWKQNLF